MGDYSAYAMTGTFDSTDWRGYVKPYIGNGYQEREEPWVPGAQDIPVLITMHIARLFREPEYTLATRHDWSKIQRILRRTWPVRPPTFAECPPSPWPQRFAFDTEFNPSTYDGDTSLVRYSMSWGVHDEQTCVVEEEDIKTPLVAGRLTVVTQSAPADIYRLAKVVGIPARDVWTTFRIHDTIVKHAVLHPDHPHDLNYLGSIYASINRWKHLADDHPQLYAGCDAFGTLEVDNALERELDADPRSRWIYENVDGPAHRIFVDAQRRGVRTDPERITEVVGVLETATQDAQAHARAAVGWPINLGSSQQVGHQLYTVEGIKKPRGYK